MRIHTTLAVTTVCTSLVALPTPAGAAHGTDLGSHLTMKNGKYYWFGKKAREGLTAAGIPGDL